MSYRLVIQRRGRRPQVFRLLQPSVIIGRGKGTDLLLPDISVSRHHARVERVGDDGYRLVDLGSQNGTKVNGQKVDTYDLKRGDELQIGKFLLIYEFKPNRTVEDPATGIDTYTLEGERTGFLNKVSAVDGNLAHATTALSKEQLDAVRRQARVKENGKVVHDASGDSWKVGTGGVKFGKGGLEIQGGGLGGAAEIRWSGDRHEVVVTGGLFFSVTVNGTKVDGSRALAPGDKLRVGKSEFSYVV
jgi:pSer/pThr/pTyr-binding forkhead associated (FHA) protein